MNKKLICLGIESTAHTLGVCLINGTGKLIKENRSMYTKEKGGIIPSEAAEHHKKIKDNLLKNLLEQTKTKFKDIDFISVASGFYLGF